ncbi:hypothetical protein WMY93_013010 [Mugilogobius chulae]|uniref:Ig-like domain-containing protein n=1 Tax=Mugilogobius chulae TaxID=88201 RepID=A0AAW0P297_9GOBI
MQDTGTYTCMVSNTAGNISASAVLNVSSVDNSGVTYFTTVTVETIETIGDESHTPLPPFGWVSSSTTKGTPVSTRTTERTYTIPVLDVDSEGTFTGLDEVMKTTKIIIGCFVAITLMAAVLLVIFYKMRKQHNQQDPDGPASSMEVITVEEELAGVALWRGTSVCPAGSLQPLQHLQELVPPRAHAQYLTQLGDAGTFAHPGLLQRQRPGDSDLSRAGLKHTHTYTIHFWNTHHRRRLKCFKAVETCCRGDNGQKTRVNLFQRPSPIATALTYGVG